MRLKHYLIGMTLMAVVSDSMLHPFFPQFFHQRFGISDPRHIGYYIAASCLTIMFSFPFWARIARKVPELKLLIPTQLIAGLLSLYCYVVDELTAFWVASMAMIWFKGSYLLVYPYIMKLVTKAEHSSTVGLLSVVVHFGSIMGALFGGGAIERFDPKVIYLLMAAGDFLQMSMCAFLFRKASNFTQAEQKTKAVYRNFWNQRRYVVKIGLTTLMLYFSVYLVRPFFSVYWQFVSAYDSQVVTGLVYAIPGGIALLALWLAHKYGTRTQNSILMAIAFCVCGLALQSITSEMSILLGRVVYGWGTYQVVVRFDVLLFQQSKPEDYASDYSKVHFCQSLGVLFASFSAGLLVDHFSLEMPFYVALLGFACTALCYSLSFKITFLTNFHFNKNFKKQPYE